MKKKKELTEEEKYFKAINPIKDILKSFIFGFIGLFLVFVGSDLVQASVPVVYGFFMIIGCGFCVVSVVILIKIVANILHFAH